MQYATDINTKTHQESTISQQGRHSSNRVGYAQRLLYSKEDTITFLNNKIIIFYLFHFS